MNQEREGRQDGPDLQERMASQGKREPKETRATKALPGSLVYQGRQGREEYGVWRASLGEQGRRETWETLERTDATAAQDLLDQEERKELRELKAPQDLQGTCAIYSKRLKEKEEKRGMLAIRESTGARVRRARQGPQGPLGCGVLRDNVDLQGQEVTQEREEAQERRVREVRLDWMDATVWMANQGHQDRPA